MTLLFKLKNQTIYFLSILVLVLLFILPIVFSIEITEVYYDPPGLDNNLEFIEIKLNTSNIDNNSYTNLSNYIIADLSSNDTLVLKHFVNLSYALIVEDGFIYDKDKINCSIYTVGNTIGNNLNNDEDEIFLYDTNSKLLDNMSYKLEISGNNSLNKYNNSWILAEPNPCLPYIISSVFEIENNSLVENFTNDSISNSSNNSIINLTNNNCDFYLLIESDKFLYDNEPIKFKHLIYPFKPENFSIEYYIEDLYGHIVKESYTTKNTNKKYFTPKKDGANIYRIISKLNVDSCNDTNLSNNNNEFLFLHKSVNEFFCPEINYNSCDCSKTTYDNKYPYPSRLMMTNNIKTSIDILNLDVIINNSINKLMNVELLVAKGNTRKKAIYIYAKNNRNYLTEKKIIYFNNSNSIKKFNLTLKFKNISLENIDKGILFIDGLGIKINKTFTILENDFFEKQKLSLQLYNDYKEKYNDKNNLVHNNNTLELTNNIDKNKITFNYIKDNFIQDIEKEKRIQLIPYFFLIASILLNFILIFKK